MTNDQKELAKKIKMIIMDVDGTLSDGRFYMLPDGKTIKSFDVKDGAGIILAHLAGIKTAIISGKSSPQVKLRCKELQIDDLYENISNKTVPFFELLKKYNLQKDEVCFIGDDIGDAEVMGMVGFAAAVGDAHPLIKRISHYIAKRYGGRGAVREVIDFILDIQGKWQTIFANLRESQNWEDLFRSLNT